MSPLQVFFEALAEDLGPHGTRARKEGHTARLVGCPGWTHAESTVTA